MRKRMKSKTKRYWPETMSSGTHPAILWFNPLVDVPAAMFPFWSIAIMPEKQNSAYNTTHSEMIWKFRALSQVENRQTQLIIESTKSQSPSILVTKVVRNVVIAQSFSINASNKSKYLRANYSAQIFRYILCLRARDLHLTGW